MEVAAALRVALLGAVCVCSLGERHSLYYIYSALNKDVALPGIYEFTALGLLDDREIDYYNSKEQMKIPKQDWMKEKMEDEYWVKGTQSRKSKEQWFRVNVGILMERMRHNDSDLHVLQWRHGCEIDDSSGAVKFVRGIDEYSYDGSEFLSFDDQNMRWIAPVPEATPTKQKWDDVAILNQYTKGYLEKECVDWLTKFMDYGKQSLRKHSPPDVYVFAKKSQEKLTLTCLATGFYPKDVGMSVRKYSTSLPEHLLTSSGVRPNDDGTYQLRKSVDIDSNEKARYDCYVTHSSFDGPIIKEWAERTGLVGIIVGVLVVAGVLCAVVFALKKFGIIGGGRLGGSRSVSSGSSLRSSNPSSQTSAGHGMTNGTANGTNGEALLHEQENNYKTANGSNRELLPHSNGASNGAVNGFSGADH
ncbi:class I histocompatibility antigen, F10 alpha chain-like [Salminus brasiliensis]|uniref:class I histocompatibility antigen, F10 alpha chain-like n=1 Tax=Salminus brasiliensis TaxID=930266 RepID=UPI003B82F269